MATLRDRLTDPGFTPSVRQLGELLALAGSDEELESAARKAILRIERQYAERVLAEGVAAARAAERPARGRLTALVAQLAKAGDPASAGRGWLLEALADADPKTRRAAVRGLGNLDRSPEITAALGAAFDASTNDDDRKALALALGKAGDARAKQKDFGKAAVIAEREEARRTAAQIDLDASLVVPVWLHVRSGLEAIAREELGGAGKLVSPGILEATVNFRIASRIRTAMHVGLPQPPRAWKRDLAEEVVVLLAEALPVFRAFTRTDGPIRFRLSMSAGKAVVWKIAELARERVPGLLNDPKESTWEVVVTTVGQRGTGSVRIELVPHAFEDERFAYRTETVPASSHPTIAAALARVAPRRDDDVVWDPFTGAGAELVERAKLGKYARLVGTDVDPKALASARTNLANANVTATLTETDATTYELRPTLILTNPPMGRRVERGAHADLLERFASHAARILAPGGHLVWIVPPPSKRIFERAAAAGLTLVRQTTIDMGGFSGELSVHRKG